MTAPDELVQAAVAAADELGRDIADVPVAVIARHAGMSRSTLLRRLGGSRGALDEAVRACGIDPGGVPPVRTRAVDAAADLIGENGLAAVTLEAIAAHAKCSVPSLYVVFGSRDGLLLAVFEQYSPLRAIEEFLAEPPKTLRDTVGGLYRVVAGVLGAAPRVVPAMFAELFARPNSAAVQALAGQAIPRVLAVVGGWLAGEVSAGRIRDLPLPLLLQQLMAPMMVHLLTRPIAEDTGVIDLPDLDTTCDVFADNFIRAVAPPTKRKNS
jgi:AcrR family transcriptional regulator